MERNNEKEEPVQTSTPPQKEAQTQPREEHEMKENTNRELKSQLKEAKDGENSSSEKTCVVCHKGYVFPVV